MVYCCQVVFVVVFEYWEVDYLQWCLFVFVSQIQVFIQFQMQCVQCVGYYFFVVGVEEDYVFILCVGVVKDCFYDFSGQEFGYWVVDFVYVFGMFGYFNIGQFFCVVDFYKVVVFVNQFVGQRGFVWDVQGCYVFFWIVGWVGKDCEFYRFQQVGDVYQFYWVMQIWFIGVIVMFGFGEGYDWEFVQVDVFYFQLQLMYYCFYDFMYLWCGYKGGFYVDLGEFRLMVGMQVFIVEVFDDLIVVIEVGYYQQLFEQLW